jgi:hypothetical protein
MTNVVDTSHCPHCGRPISGQETTSLELSAYVEQLRPYTLMPSAIQEILRQQGRISDDHRLLAILVIKMDYWAELIEQHTQHLTASSKDRLINEVYANFLNRSFETLIPVIERTSGSVLELWSGGTLAVWGIPASVTFFAEAVTSALEMQRVQLRWQETSDPDLSTGLKIGLAGGQVYVGAIGTHRHRSYTVVGPAVTRAIRLSEIAEPGQTLVDHTVYEETKDTVLYERPNVELATTSIQSQYYMASESVESD